MEQMINITLYNDGFTVEGHAEHGGYGHDIVCSAISMISQTVAGMLRIEGAVEDVIRFGYVNARITEQNERTELLFDVFKYGVTNVARAYPKNVKIIVENVNFP